MTDRIVVTLDGLAGTGKTTLAHLLAARLGFVHLNTGGLYRAVGLLCVREQIAYSDEPSILGLFDRHTFDFVLDEHGSSQMRIDGVKAGSELFTAEVSEATSATSLHPRLRERLVLQQRQAFPGRNLVAEGRDMGTVIFPDAHLKFFVVADAGVRASRRMAQLKGQGNLPADASLIKRKLEMEIFERDKRDSERPVAPTKAAPDAIIVDNSAQSLTEVVEEMYQHARTRGVVGA